jgi:hypothetical protein
MLHFSSEFSFPNKKLKIEIYKNTIFHDFLRECETLSLPKIRM